MELPAHLANFITKQQVAQLYPISERTVQRHISSLIRKQDRDALQHLALVTDDEARDGTDVTFELIEELNRNGQKPRWYLLPSYAESVFGAKPEPLVYQTPPARPLSPPPTAAPPREQGAAVSSSEPQAAFLIERITSLERQMQEERQRHDQLIAKLFAQLDVKDKQISAWDEVTQGLTKALATGQLTPAFSRMLPHPTTPSTHSTPHGPAVDVEPANSPDDDEPQRAPRAQPTNSPVDAESHSTSNVTKKPRRPKPKPAKPPSSSVTAEANSADSPPKWWETPTLNKLFRHRGDR